MAEDKTQVAAPATSSVSKRYVVLHKAITLGGRAYVQLEVLDGAVFGDAITIARLVDAGAIREARPAEAALDRVHSLEAPSAENISFEEQLQQKDSLIAELRGRIDDLQGRLDRATGASPKGGGSSAPAKQPPADTSPNTGNAPPPPPPPPGGGKSGK